MPDPTGRISHLPDMHRGVSWKQPCRVATTTNITIATALNAGDTIDGVTLAAGDRVLVKDQSTGSQNGIYLAGVTPIRDFDMDQDAATSVPASEVLGAVIHVIAGTVNGGTIWRNTNTTAPVLGTTALTFTQLAVTDLSAIDFLVGTASGLLSGEIVVGTTPGGELGNTWASPTVDASHSGSTHAATQAAAEATAAAALAAHAALATGDHEHVVGETFSGDGATTVFEIANEPIDLEAVAGFVAGLRVALTVSGDMNTTVTFAVAPASGTDNVVIDYPAVAA